jgi:DNA modification methylase
MYAKGKKCMNIEYIETDKLIPYVNNAKLHPEDQVGKIASSIKNFGFRQPLVVDAQNEVIAGHGRLQAAKKMGMEQVPCVRADDLSKAQVKALRLSDNRTAQSDWDWDLVKVELDELQGLDFDIALTGFDEGEIDALLAESTPQGNTDEDEVPEEPEDPVTRIGDVWLLGRHRVRCGDSTSADDVAALLNGVEPHLMVTDPPYGVNYDPKWRAEAGVNKNKGKMGAVQNDNEADWRDAWSLFPGDVAYVWHAGAKAHIVAEGLEATGFTLRSQIIWAKDRFALSRGDYHWQHEPCWYAVKGKGHFAGDRKQSTLWQIPARDDSGVGHGTQKPVECMRRPIVNNSAPGQPVYDPFLGSGTTLIAGETEGRPVYGMEIDPKYCDVIVTRWQEFTGKDAVLESSGQTFNEVQNGRKTQKSND